MTIMYRHAHPLALLRPSRWGMPSTGSPCLHAPLYVVPSVVLATALIGYAIQHHGESRSGQTLRYRPPARACPPGDARGRHGGVPAVLPRPRDLQSLLGIATHDTRRRTLGDRRAHRAARVRVADAAPDTFPGGRDGAARAEAGARTSTRRCTTHLTDLPNRLLFLRSLAEGDRRTQSRRAGRSA